MDQFQIDTINQLRHKRSMTSEAEALGAKIKQLRTNAGHSQQRAADALGVTPQTVSQWENGGAFPTIPNLLAFAKLVDSSASDLMKALDAENRMLIPLKEYICDTCSGVIENPEDGWLEWLDAPPKCKPQNFRICHHKRECMVNIDHLYVSDTDLSNILRNAPQFIYSFLGVQPNAPSSSNQIQAENLDELMELARRLTVPHYEEARQYFPEAEANGDLDGMHAMSAHTNSNLQGVIKTYGPYRGGTKPAAVPSTFDDHGRRLAAICKHFAIGEDATSEKAKTALRKCGEELNRLHGFAGMTKAFDAAKLTEQQESAIDYAWHGIGDWLS